MIFCGSLSFAAYRPEEILRKSAMIRQKNGRMGAGTARERKACGRPDERQKTISRCAQHRSSSTDLIRAERSFNFGLVVPDQIKAIRSDTADPVKYKNALFAAVKNDIAAAEKMNRIRLNDGLIVRDEKADTCCSPAASAGSRSRLLRAVQCRRYTYGTPF